MLVNKDKNMEPFNMQKKPCKQNLFLLPFIWVMSFILTRKGKLTIEKKGMKGLKPPYLVLAEHQGFTDYYILPLSLFPHRVSYVSDVEGFANFGKWLYSQVGCIATRRFSSGISLIKNISHAVHINKNIVVIFPEARHSNVGTNSDLPNSVGKLVKLLNIPVVLIKSHGSYLTSPIWDESHTRKVPLYVTMEKILDINEIDELASDEITEKVNQLFKYDEYKWQSENKIKIDYSKRTEGLDKILYFCPNCKTEFNMISYDSYLKCEKCSKIWQLSEYGEMISLNGKTEFPHIPNWYEFQRAEVNKEIDNCLYNLTLNADVYALPNEKGFVFLGNAVVNHNSEGFTIKIIETNEEFKFSAKSLYSVHTEYNYRDKGDCIVLSTNECCYYIYSTEKNFNVTKIQFATEKFYKDVCKTKNSP